MITKFSWRRAVAVPAVVTLALGGALLSTTAAQAAQGDLLVSSPATGTTTDSRTVTVTGSATPGAAIEVFTDATETTSLGTAVTDATSGAYTAALTPYADDATPEQSVFVVESFPDEADETAAVDFFLPNLDVTSPEPGATSASRTVEVTGTGIPTATVNLSPSVGDAVIGQIRVGADPPRTGSATRPADATPEQTITVDPVLGGSGRGQVVLPVVLPAVVTPPTTPVTLPAPVITAPTQGSTVTGTEVTFEGTGTPGADIGLLVAPTPADDVSTLADDPAARIIVDQNGDWDVTLALQPGTYSAVAFQALVDDAGQPVVDENGLPVLSDDSTPVDFTLEAAAVAPFAAPVVTSPAAGQAVVGSTLTVTGTGTPGARVAFVLYAQGGQPASSGPFEEAQAESTIVVDAAGNWTSTVTGVRPGAYTIAPFSFALNAAGEATAVALGVPVDFTVVAAVVPAAAPTTPTGLAYTGSEGTETAAGIGAAALLAGALLLIAARRRAKLAVAETPAE
ncbi:hypothetical protein [Frigoribacterium sp. RIT-PI-h]|uniref:hypothetical protein n=1 Tax=Frigoribacterium sp. RIT-PI-h TaxID=1690245 RepID=UPI0006B892C0|nr:hypothetical protein [Frigoribacterium sp. RIT-PI-h]KPG80013.1 hypothetical protein AEQ27_12880 [Frigoribacterium sp. RIT-PI-h]